MLMDRWPWRESLWGRQSASYVYYLPWEWCNMCFPGSRAEKLPLLNRAQI